MSHYVPDDPKSTQPVRKLGLSHLIRALPGSSKIATARRGQALTLWYPRSSDQEGAVMPNNLYQAPAMLKVGRFHLLTRGGCGRYFERRYLHF